MRDICELAKLVRGRIANHTAPFLTLRRKCSEMSLQNVARTRVHPKKKYPLLFLKIYRSFVTPQILLVYFKLCQTLSRDFSSFGSRSTRASENRREENTRQPSRNSNSLARQISFRVHRRAR